MARIESDEANTKRVTVRVPKHLVEDYDEALEEQDTNRSEAIRQHMRRTVSQPTTDGGLVPPQDDETLASAYQELRRISTDDASIPLKEARSVFASKLNIPKGRVLKPLRERGYLRRTGDPDACEFLTDACGYDEDDVAQILDDSEDVAGYEDFAEIEEFVGVGFDPWQDQIAEWPEMYREKAPQVAEGRETPHTLQKHENGAGDTVGSEWIYSDNRGKRERRDTEGIAAEMASTHYGRQGQAIEV